MQIRRDQLLTVNDFQILLRDISKLQSPIGIQPDELINLNTMLDGDKVLNSPCKLSAEAKRELSLTEEKLEC